MRDDNFNEKLRGNEDKSFLVRKTQIWMKIFHCNAKIMMEYEEKIDNFCFMDFLRMKLMKI